MTTLKLTWRQLKWAEKLTEYNFKITYWEGKKNLVNDLSKQLNYELSKTVSTLTAAEMMWQFFHLESKNYKSVQKELYILTAMTLQSKHSVQQLQQKNVIFSTINTEDDDITETSAVHHLSAYRASYNENNKSVISESKDSEIIKTSTVHDLYA